MDFKNEFIIELIECILSGADELQVKHILDKETHNLQLKQTGVSGSYSEFPHKKVCFFKVENGKYLTDNGMEITNEMLIKHSHHIGFPWNYIVLE
jgi:hypothetical protein